MLAKVKELEAEVASLKKELKEVAGMGAWGNYMTYHYLKGLSLDDINVIPEELPRLIRQAEDYEKFCADRSITLEDNRVRVFNHRP